MARLSRKQRQYGEQRKHREQRRVLIETYLSQHPDATLKQIGDFLGVSKQRAHILLKRVGLATRQQGWRHFPTERQTEILRYVASGYTNKQIAAIFGVSEWSIKSQVTSILGKLNAKDRAQAVMLARQQGLI
jgi:DNA-binding CsgD family transcriptional regulator